MSEIVDVVDKAIDKFVGAVQAAGPSVEYAFNDVIGLIVVTAIAKIITILLFTIVAWSFFGRFLTLTIRSYKTEKESEKTGRETYEVISIVSGVASVIALIFIPMLPTLIGRAFHPVGYLVLQLL